MLGISDNKIRTGGQLSALALLFIVFFIPNLSEASVPTVGGVQIFQQHPDDTDKQIAWCDEWTISGTTTIGYPTEIIDANGFKYWNIDDTNGQLSFDHDNDCLNQSQFFQTARGIPDKSQGTYWLHMITGNETGDTNPALASMEASDFNWYDATGNAETCTPYSELQKSLSFGGVNYRVTSFKCSLQQDTSATDGQGGWIEEIISFGASGNDGFDLYYLTYTAASSTNDLTQIVTSADLQTFLSDVNGTDWTDFQEEIPPSTQNYIVITEPEPYDRSVAYSPNVSGQLNLVGVATGTKSYKITFLSQSGVTYGPSYIQGTTSNYSLYDFTLPATQLAVDDIVYVRAYLYDNATWSGLPAYISKEYEWWISSSGNVTDPIDLGTVRTHSSSTCSNATGFGSSTTLVNGIGYVLCSVGSFLFVPSQSSLESVTSQIATATSTFPFSYMWDVNQYMDTLFTYNDNVVWSITLASSTPVFGNTTLLSSSDIDTNSNYQIVRSFFGVMVYLALIIYIYKRSKRISASL